MEVSESISVHPNPDITNNHSHSHLGFLPSPDPDPDPAPADLEHAPIDELQKLDLKEEDEGGDFQKLDLREGDEVGDFQKLDLKEEDEVVKFQRLDLKEKENEEENKEGDVEEAEKKSSNGGEIEIEIGNENEDEVQSEQSNGEGGGGGEEVRSEDGSAEERMADGSSRRYQYPVRPEAEDCAYYLKTGSCKFGSNCKFNHPVRRKTNQLPKDRVKEREESAEKASQTECKYYLRSGGCKYGKACRYSHSKGKPSVAPVLELNFLGLPIRPGESVCPYYMRNGSCKYASNCRFNHPDPTATGRSDSLSRYGNGSSASLLGTSQSTLAPWSAQRSLKESPGYAPMMIPPAQGISSKSTEWNDYQTPSYLPERNMPARPPYGMNNSVNETNIYKQYPQQNQVEEFPERPGQPVCRYFVRTGDCKFKSNCKYHHPKTQTAVPTQCALSDKGLPLRPDQNICSHYSRYGICKYGPACKYDHPLHISSSTASGPDHQLPFSDSVISNGVGPAGSRSVTDATIQLQPVQL